MKQTTKQVVKLTREQKGRQIYEAGLVARINDNDDLYWVTSQTDNEKGYEVIPLLNKCQCIDHERNPEIYCKHIVACTIHRTERIKTVMKEAIAKMGGMVLA